MPCLHGYETWPKFLAKSCIMPHAALPFRFHSELLGKALSLISGVVLSIITVRQLTTCDSHSMYSGPRFINPMAFQQHFDSSMIKFCSMHVINLGVMQYAAGASLDLLLSYNFFGLGTLSEQLAETTESFRRWASSSGISHSQCYLTPAMLYHNKQGREYPCLTLKAFNARVFLPFLVLCLRMLFQENNDLETGLAYTCMHRLSCFMDLLERCGRYLSNAEAVKLHEHGRKFADQYTRLAQLCITKKILRWHYTPKLHVMVQHLLVEPLTSQYNVRHHHCFIDEDLMGQIKGLCRRVHWAMLEWRALSRFQLRLRVWQSF